MLGRTIVFVLALISQGCAHRFETVVIDAETLQPKGTQRLEGVIYYEPHLVKHTFEFTALKDKDGHLVGLADDGKCRRSIQKEEVVILPDYSRPMAILYKPSIFAAGTFGVALKDGLLGGVNVASTPQLPALLEQVAGVVETFSFDPSRPAMCNANPVLARSVQWRVQ